MNDIRFEQLGLVASLMGKSKTYSLYHLACLNLWIAPAIAHQQIRFAFNSKGKPLAYWTWAFLAPDVEHRLIHDPNVLLHESEWNEGGNLWIMDFVAPHGHVRDIVRYIQNSMSKNIQQAYSIRRNRDGAIRKTSVWHRGANEKDPRSSECDLVFRLPSTAFAASRTAWLKSGCNKINT